MLGKRKKKESEMKRILIGTVAMIMAMPCFAEDTPATGDKRITSKPYVDNAVATRQDKIPAANLSNTNYGETVMTYTPNGDGEIGERALFTGGEYDASTDADKLITASALNTAFTTLPETQTTKLVCANQSDGCTLWTITDQTAYGVSGDSTTTIDLSALAGTNGTGSCYKILIDGTVSAGTCTTAPEKYGDWGVMFTYNNEPVQVSGISACSTVDEGLSQGEIPTNQTGVQSDYESNMSAAPTNAPVGGNCYCKLTDPSTSAARWVFMYSNPVLYCAMDCASSCADSVWVVSDFRAAVFNSVQ